MKEKIEGVLYVVITIAALVFLGLQVCQWACNADDLPVASSNNEVHYEYEVTN